MDSNNKINFDEVQKSFYEKTWTEEILDYKSRPGVPNWISYIPNTFFVKFLDQLEISPCSKFLDVGCGAGRHTVYAAEKGFLAYGIDFCKAALKKAKIHAKNKGVGKRTGFLCSQAYELPFEDNFFDLINDSGCFNHINPKHWNAYSKEIFRVLKKGGIYRLKAVSHNSRDVWGYIPGIKDRWILQTNNQYKYYFKKEELEKIFSNLEIVKLRDRFISKKNKFFFMVAKKK
ncbi:MAG: class I SAM-dependent methyltransferase [Nanoarchaeota archaeon]|nr:class I SAM-dependent methyltransferase [Nanoarchaeota archaeon]